VLFNNGHFGAKKIRDDTALKISTISDKSEITSSDDENKLNEHKENDNKSIDLYSFVAVQGDEPDGPNEFWICQITKLSPLIGSSYFWKKMHNKSNVIYELEKNKFNEVTTVDLTNAKDTIIDSVKTSLLESIMCPEKIMIHIDELAKIKQQLLKSTESSKMPSTSSTKKKK